MAEDRKHFIDEADIGSGERSPAQQDIDRETQKVNVPLPHVGRPQDGSQFGHEVIEEQDYANQRPRPEEERPIMGAGESDAPGKVLQSGTHIARIAAPQLPDGTYEAQVFVRLTREPELAETYIPVGTHPTAEAALKAAEERAQRAFKEHEF
ncbi:hypothetical protein SAMN06265795_102460 [Noviherbaspirillum humi]|uniref:Uncharacterized protein n=1 Tax=Noviherbaspirillum humi TaxID=1688639 RepID=A0A239E0Z6_9BURK|nr:hypothetical protein [Noviherbaspirillum humi]SNS38041.1 hypothetical protein SAMN06265795_102460 [Noviherbaspirillum humi]